MIASPKAVGAAHLRAGAAKTVGEPLLERRARGRARRCRSPSRRRQFSTMITAPSTIRPKSIAPRLIRLPLILVCTMPIAVSSIESGIASAVMSAARKLPSSSEQHDDDEQRALGEVRRDGARSSRRPASVRSSTVFAPGCRAAASALDLARILRVDGRARRCGCSRRSASAPCRRRPPRRSRWRCRCAARAPMPTRRDVARRGSARRRARRPTMARDLRRLARCAPGGAHDVRPRRCARRSRRRCSRCCARAPRARRGR